MEIILDEEKDEEKMYIPLSIGEDFTLALGVFNNFSDATKSIIEYLSIQANFDEWLENESQLYLDVFQTPLTLEILQEALFIVNPNDDNDNDDEKRERTEEFWDNFFERNDSFKFTIARGEKGTLFPFFRWNWDFQSEEDMKILYTLMENAILGKSYTVDQDYRDKYSINLFKNLQKSSF